MPFKPPSLLLVVPEEPAPPPAGRHDSSGEDLRGLRVSRDRGAPPAPAASPLPQQLLKTRPACVLSLRLPLQDSLEFKPDGHVSMLGKSLRGDYVFSSEGDLIKAGQSTSFYKVRPCQAAGSVP